MKHRSRSPSWLAALAIALGTAGCVPGGDEASTSALTGDEAARARTLYANSGCGTCHGEAAEGIDGGGPRLAALASYWNVERIEAYLRDPRAFRTEHPDFEARRDPSVSVEMPAFDSLSSDELRLLARWLLSL